MRCIFALSLMTTILLVIGEGFTGRSSGSLLIRGILCIPRRRFRFKWWPPSLCTAQLLLQLINLTLHVFLILCMGHMTFPRDWLLLGCMVCPLFSRSPLCWGFTSDWLCCEPPDFAWCGLSLPWCGPIVGWCEPDSSILCTKPKSLSDQIKQFPQTTPIVRTKFDLNPEQEWIQAQKARTINL